MPDEIDQSKPIDLLTIGELISLADAAELSGLSQSYLKQAARKGRLPAKKVARNWLTTITAVNEYLKSRHRGKRTDIDKKSL